VEDAMGQTLETIRKVHQSVNGETGGNTYFLEETNGRGAVVYKPITPPEFFVMEDALKTKLKK